MKIYIVTTGSYSDYTIDKVFTDKAKAEEYKEWLDDSNDIEEYETEDDLVVNKYYRMRIHYKKYSNGEFGPDIQIYKQHLKENHTWYYEGSDYNGAYINLTLIRCIEAQNWNEEFYRNKYTKTIYDLMAIAKQKRFEGASEGDIKRLFEGYDNNTK